MLKRVALSWPNSNASFTLSCADLFYQSIYTLDMLRGMVDKADRRTYCKLLWEEINDYLNTNVDAVDNEIEDAASLVTQTVGALLYATDVGKYLEEYMELQKGDKNELTPAHFLLLKPLMDSRKNAKLVQWLSDYMNGTDSLSDEIENELGTLREKKKVEEDERKKELLSNAQPGAKIFLDNSKNIDNRQITKFYINQEDKTKQIK